jgi:TRAP-type C4-dicarboxylate transport system substrate-binding protein
MKRFALVLALLLTACGMQEPAGVTTLIYATPYAPNHPFSVADKTWIKWVEAQSGGSLRIHAVWSGALISSDQSITELRHGVADIGLITPIYAKGGERFIKVQTAFYGGAATYAQQVALYRCLQQRSPLFDDELRGLKILAIQGGTLPGVLLRNRPLNSLDDFRGLRIRAPTELLNVLRDLGADPVNMPMGEVYSALAKGVLDGVIAPTDTLKSLHFGDVAHYYTSLEVPRGAYPARAMGERRWLSLTAEQRAVLERSIPIWEAAMAEQTKAAVSSGEAQGRKDGVQFLPIAAAEQQRFDALYERDAERNARTLQAAGVDAVPVFEAARHIAQGIAAHGDVDCSAGVKTDP